MSDYFILLDVGGTYIKSATRPLRSPRLENILIDETPKFNQGSSDEIRELSMSELLFRINHHIRFQIKNSKSCLGILISGQMGGYQVCDSSFNLSETFVSWQDLRGRIRFSMDSSTTNGYELAYRGWADMDKAKTGYEVRENTPYVGLFTDLFTTRKTINNVGFISLLLGVSRGLVTDFAPYMHVTDAASSGMLDISKFNWMLEKFPTNSQITFPTTTQNLLPIGINTISNGNVYTPVGDQQASLLGMNLSSENIIFNIGTGGQVSKILDSYDTNLKTQQRPYFDSKFIQTVTHLPSGRLLNEFISFLFDEDLSPENYSKFNTWGEGTGEFIEFKTEEFNALFCQFQNNNLSDFEKRLIARSFFEHLASHYADAYQLIDPNGILNPIIGGGMGQKMSSLVSSIERKIQRKLVVSDSKETTLTGLGKLIEKLI